MARKKAAKKKARRKPPARKAPPRMSMAALQEAKPTDSPYVYQPELQKDRYRVMLGYHPVDLPPKHIHFMLCKDPPCTCVPEGVAARLITSAESYLRIYEADDAIYVCFDPSGGGKGTTRMLRADVCKDPPCT